ncbi:right-handed parallel beta-helix repeat-containing protein [Paenibacillus pasadenensis]|uniref:right-handed parallel beta-helix repeat-containing protein n=1 Tax=Paenibacillus pasadenensis TaxID=217090 RepID=UPI00203E7BC9|nr:right-handed parallel beta-helix repeat-containing protein [Paenibacillus pasadenensis]MCM3748841.1 right-handed parallel beta-helix repeat-containing protein [Paenibacillus pasadenensis]
MSKNKHKTLVWTCVAVLFAALLPFWPIQTAAAAGTTYYVDSSGGNDANDGLSPGSAWQHLSKVNGTTFAPGDTILLKSGSSWTEQLYPKGSGTAGNPIKINRYGTGAKPIINFNIASLFANGGEFNSNGAVFLKNQEYWELSNLDVTNNLGNGVSILNFNGGSLNYIRLNNLNVHDTAKNGILLSSDGETISKWNDVIIENNTITNAGTQAAIRTEANRIGASTTPARSTNLLVRNNVVTDSKYDGIVVTDSTNPLIEYNVVNGAGTTAGYYDCIAGIWAFSTSGAVFQHNEAFNVKNTNGLCDRQGFDADYETTATTFQYNYSHDNAGGFLLVMGSAFQVTVRYNMIMEAGFNGSAGGHLTAYNNTIYVPADAVNPDITSDTGTENMIATGSSKNNIVYRAGTVGKLPTDGAMKSNNLIYGISLPTSYNSTNLNVDPQFVGPLPTTMPIGINNVGAFRIKPTSPAINAGALIASNGGKDYFGGTVVADDVPNIGADNRYNTPPAAVIVDNGTAGYQETSGTFSNSSLPGYNNSSTRYSNAIGASVKWTPTLDAGTYKVSIYRVVNSSSDNNAQVLVNSAAGLSSPISVNFTSGTSGWHELGTYTFNAGTGGYVTNTFSGNSGKNLRADAVRFEKIS